MADNRHLYGFRWHGNLEGGCCPKPIEFTVKTAFDFSTQAGGAVDLNVGDPVVMDTDGTVILATAAVGAAQNLFGVVASINNAKVDANGYSRPASFLPVGTTWATEALRSKVGIIPFGRNTWEIDGNQVFAGATTIANYRVLLGGNVNFIYSRDVTNANRPKANPLLNLAATPDATATKDFRLLDISHTADNFDFSGNFVKLVVVVNSSGEAPFNKTGVA